MIGHDTAAAIRAARYRTLLFRRTDGAVAIPPVLAMSIITAPQGVPPEDVAFMLEGAEFALSSGGAFLLLANHRKARDDAKRILLAAYPDGACKPMGGVH